MKHAPLFDVEFLCHKISVDVLMGKRARRETNHFQIKLQLGTHGTGVFEPRHDYE